MRASNMKFGVAALMLVLLTGGRALALQSVDSGGANSEMSSESGREGGDTSSTSESSVDTSASISDHTTEYSSSATTQFNTENSSLASSESGLVMTGGEAVPDNPAVWGVVRNVETKAQPQTAAQPAREIHAQVKYYHW
jgi:hypothetical protein